MREKYSMGVDIGGTKVAVALINEAGEILFRSENPSDTKTAETMFKSVVDCINEVLKNSDLEVQDIIGMGVGVPGKVDVENGIAVFQNNIPWPNFPLVDRLKAVFGNSLKVHIDNDVKMAAYAEYKTTNNEPNDLFTYITISTGIACTSIIDNEIIRGSGFSGEIGFIPVKEDKEYVTVENYASGPAIQKARDADSTKEVFEQALHGDQNAKAVIQKSAHAIALSVYSIVCILDPKAIVFGGSVAYYNPSFVEEIKNQLAEFLSEEQEHILTDISVSQIGGDNGVIGAGLMGYDL